MLGAGSVTPVLGLVVADDETTMSVADAVSDFAPDADTFAETWICSPAVAPVPTFTTAWISEARPSGRLPTLQVVPCADGHTLKLAAPI